MVADPVEYCTVQAEQSFAPKRSRPRPPTATNILPVTTQG